jgi:type IV secretion system protein VirB1
MELMGCQGLAVPAEVMHHVVRVESSFNPYAIGVVGGRLARQPKNLPEALSTVRMLESRGYNFSLGLAQVNRYNLQKYGLDSYERAFEPCSNLVAGSQILAECYRRSGADWGKSFSCYYSGNFTTGFRHGYVQKVYASMRQGRDVDAGMSTATPAIEVLSREARRTVPVSRYPLYAAAGIEASAVAAAIPASPPISSRLGSTVAAAPARPSRFQEVPSRVVAAAPVAAPQPDAYAPAQAGVSPAVVPQVLSGAPAVTRETVPQNNGPTVATQPGTGAVAPSTAGRPSQAAAPRPRAERDPALVGGKGPEQDSAFVF